MTKPEIKKKISGMKDLNLQALESGDSKKVSWFTHQIGQLKKKSRRIPAA
jgi:hypothetical protein